MSTYSDIILEKETYVNCICTPFYTMERRSNSGFTWVITLCFTRLLNSQKLLINSRIRDYLESSKLHSKSFYFFKKLMKLFSYHWNRSSELYTLLSDIIERNTWITTQGRRLTSDEDNVLLFEIPFLSMRCSWEILHTEFCSFSLLCSVL